MKTELEKTLDSLDNMQRAMMPPALRDRILGAMPLQRVRTIAISKTTAMLLAAGLALLIGFNVYSIAWHDQHLKSAGAQKPHHAQSNPLTDEYFMPAPSI